MISEINQDFIKGSRTNVRVQVWIEIIINQVLFWNFLLAPLNHLVKPTLSPIVSATIIPISSEPQPTQICFSGTRRVVRFSGTQIITRITATLDLIVTVKVIVYQITVSIREVKQTVTIESHKVFPKPIKVRPNSRTIEVWIEPII